MSYNALRHGRHSQLQQIYHITAVTKNRQPTFTDWAKGRAVVHTLIKLSEEDRAHTLCYVVMPDHLHWLMELNSGTLAEVMQLLKGRSARELNSQLWQPGFHDHALRKEEDVISLARYIVTNPLRAGLVRNVADYPLWDAIWL
ncbi:MAG: REP-associated tyrosine transposase [Moraxellaceae bacterium]